MKKIVLDNGHGKETAGKRSPKWADGSQLFEYEFNRDIVRRISENLKQKGLTFHILVPELTDISLVERCKRANAFGKDAILISVHANAGGGTGWECFTSVGKTPADQYAQILLDQFKQDFPEWKMRGHKESDFYILKNTSCPAVLSENFFMDTEKDCRLILSEEGRQRIADSHVQAILKMIEL